MLTESQADAVAAAAVRHFDCAGMIYNRMSTMRVLSPEYAEAGRQAEEHMEAGSAAVAEYKAWRAEAELRNRLDDALADCADAPYWIAEAEANEAGKQDDHA